MANDLTDVAQLQAEVQALQVRLSSTESALQAAHERQTVLAEVLRIIAASSTNLDVALHAVAEGAQRLCGASGAVINRIVDGRLQVVAVSGRAATAIELGAERPLSAASAAGRAILTRSVIHTEDARSDAFTREYPGTRPASNRSTVYLPLIRDDEAIGALSVGRSEVRPFTDGEIALVTAFADQAVIAIENARLFSELGQRTTDLSQALEQQTAQSEVLRVIAASPADLQRVLDTLVETATRLCSARSGVLQRYRARDGTLAPVAASADAREQFARFSGPAFFETGRGLELSRRSLPGRAFVDEQTVAIDDMAEAVETELPASKNAQVQWGHRSAVAVPLMHGGGAIGVLVLVRFDVRPFTAREVTLLEAFADQAVIAIENARLFAELEERNAELRTSNHQVTEALEQQTALSEVLRAIASAPTDLESVLQSILETAARLCDAENGSLLQRRDRDGRLVWRANCGVFGARVEEARAAGRLRPFDGRWGISLSNETVAGRAYLERRAVVSDDILSDPEFPEAGQNARSYGYPLGSQVSVPLLVRGEPIGILSLNRTDVRPFTERDVERLQMFADQAVIAIENARLFQELQETSTALAEASEYKSRFLANMSHELRTPLNAVIGYSEMLQEELDDLGQADLVPDVEKINAAGRHLLGLINDILDLSKIEAGKMELFLETVEVPTLVREVATTAGALVSTNANTLAVHVAPGVGTMEADATKLRQILFNLLSNAAKFTSGGAIELRVASCELRAEDDAEAPLVTRNSQLLSFSVSDTGIGMTEDQLGRLFEAFSQAEASTGTKYGGTGLGLALVRHLAQLMGGDISVASAPGVGSTFTVRIPTTLAETGGSGV